MDNYKVIGLMSGTSLDGLDMAYCHFNKKMGVWKYELLQTKCVSYSDVWKQKLKTSINQTAEELLAMDIEYGKFTGIQVNDFIQEHGLEVDFVASHGHTVYHQPDKGFTYQIGAGQRIAIESELKTISDFRSKDVAFGGQGAPLVPIGDQLLFGEYDACINLGGIANISFNSGGKRVAFDVGMANMLLNYLAEENGKAYDEGGEIARSGSVDNILLEKLNKLPYFDLPYPKSLGYEWFLSHVLPIIHNSSVSSADKMRTAVEQVAIQISLVLEKYLSKSAKVLLTGGGAFNDFLVERIIENSPNEFKISVPEPAIVNYKEAIIFAFMGVLRDRGEVNCLKSVTGATQDVSGGEVFLPK